MLERINVFTEAPTDTINTVYEIPSIARVFRYLHGSAGFPTKTTWLKSNTQQHIHLLALDQRKKCEQTFSRV